MNRRRVLIGVVLLLAAGAIVVVLGIWGPHQVAGPRRFRSNGERIYFTGADDRGERIRFSGGPMWLAMHGGSCVDCHGPDGRGGRPVMMGTSVPPDIRYQTLTGIEHEGMQHEHPPYTPATIARAITEGVDPAGHRLDPTMPRFHMSQRDVDDVIAFLKVAGEMPPS